MWKPNPLVDRAKRQSARQHGSGRVDRPLREAGSKRRNGLPSHPNRAALGEFRRRRGLTRLWTLDANSRSDKIDRMDLSSYMDTNLTTPELSAFSAARRVPDLPPGAVFLAQATRQEVARQVASLKTANQILRARLPKQIVTTAQQRRRLVTALCELKSTLPAV
jgi:hypothetical protein